jgi:hypothetical protein
MLEIPEPPDRSEGAGCAACGETASCSGIWISEAEVRALPISGESGCDARCETAWSELSTFAETTPAPTPDLSAVNDLASAYVLAKALFAVRMDRPDLRQQVRDLIAAAIPTEPLPTADVHPFAAHLPIYVIAADLVGLSTLDPSFDTVTFRPWLSQLLVREFNGYSLLEAAGVRPTHAGTTATTAYVACAIYLGQLERLDSIEPFFRGWLGDRDQHAGFEFSAAASGWMGDPNQPRPVNAAGAQVAGHNVDGVLVESMSTFSWPPPQTDDVYNALGASLVTAVLFARQGRAPWSWSDQALLRAASWIVSGASWNTDSGKAYVFDLVDWGYGSALALQAPATPDRNMAWTSWTHRPCR